MAIDSDRRVAAGCPGGVVIANDSRKICIEAAPATCTPRNGVRIHGVGDRRRKAVTVPGNGVAALCAARQGRVNKARLR